MIAEYFNERKIKIIFHGSKKLLIKNKRRRNSYKKRKRKYTTFQIYVISEIITLFYIYLFYCQNLKYHILY